MSRVIVLDTGVLGFIVHRKTMRDARIWLSNVFNVGINLRIPNIAEYELRRSLIYLNATNQIQRLDTLKTELGDDSTIPMTPEIMFEAARLWAEVRKQGLQTADDKALDGDVILAAQALSLENSFDEVTIATTNVKHLNRFSTTKMTAEFWSSIA